MIKKIRNYLFGRPDVRIGDKLAYYGWECTGVHFDWEFGTWMLECDTISISYTLELYYRKNKLKN